MDHWSLRFAELDACEDALEWCSGVESLARAWDACHRGDWMLWLLGRSPEAATPEGRRAFAACVADCAAVALPVIEDLRARNILSDCLGMVRGWARGEVTSDELALACGAADEQLRAGDVSPDSDAHAVGIVVCELSDAAAFADPATPIVRRMALCDMGSVVALYAGNIYGAAHPIYPVGRAEAFAVMAGVIRGYFPVAPLAPRGGAA